MPPLDALATTDDSAATARDTPRRLVVAWQHPDGGPIQPIGFLSFDGQVYQFAYIRHAREVKDFRPLLGFPDLRRMYRSPDLFPLFAQRAMDPRRPDYQRYLARLGLGGDPPPLEQIGRSQGRRQGDTIQLLPDPTVRGDKVTCLFLVNGMRHVPENTMTLNGHRLRVSSEELEATLAQLHHGDPLGLVHEPQNPYNPLAILVTGSSVPVGWVPDLLVEDLHRLMQSAKIMVTVDHVNGSDSPWHLRLLARLHASPARGFRFFTGDRWALLASEPDQ